MKLKRVALVIVCIPVVLGLWRVGDCMRSAQYRLDKIVASGRESFELWEVMGNDWKMLCFFPAPDIYSDLYTQSSNDMLITWMKESLERPIKGDDWRYVSAGSDNRVFRFLTDTGRWEETIFVKPWQGNDSDEYYVACTRDKKQIVTIYRKGKDVSFDAAFKRVWELNRK